MIRSFGRKVLWSTCDESLWGIKAKVDTFSTSLFFQSADLQKLWRAQPVFVGYEFYIISILKREQLGYLLNHWCLTTTTERTKICNLWFYDCCRGFLESNGNRGTQSDCTVSSSNIDEETRSSGNKAKLGGIRHLLSNSKFRNSLSLKRRRSVSLNREKTLPVPIEDIRDANDQKAVDELRNELLARNLLPSRHDDYHVLLRSVILRFSS